MNQKFSRRTALGGALAVAALPRLARADTQTIKIGMLTDLTATNSAGTGKGSVTGATLAIEDFMAANPGIKVELLVADFQAKADIALSMGRNWFDNEGVDVLVNVQNSAAALAVAGMVREKDKVALFTSPASSDLTGKACSPNHIHWTYDTWSLGHTTGNALVAQGGDSWFFIAADYACGRAVVEAMKATPTDDLPYGKGTIRADGRKIHPMYLFQVKSPSESKYAWDYYKLLQTVPAETAFRPITEGSCKFVAS